MIAVIWCMHLADAFIQGNFQCIQDIHWLTSDDEIILHHISQLCMKPLSALTFWPRSEIALKKACFACREWETGFVFNTRPAAASEDSLQYPVLSPLECCSYLSVRRNSDLSTNIHILRRGASGALSFKWRAERKASSPLEPKLPIASN